MDLPLIFTKPIMILKNKQDLSGGFLSPRAFQVSVLQLHVCMWGQDKRTNSERSGLVAEKLQHRQTDRPFKIKPGCRPRRHLRANPSLLVIVTGSQ